MHRLAVLGVLKTEYGIAARTEMLEWLQKSYNVLTVEQEPPGSLYEYPAILLALDLASKTGEPVLYLHTKGAGNPHPVQARIREMWAKEFGNPERSAEYYKLAGEAMPRLVTPIPGPGKETWFNAFVVNPLAARILLAKIKPEESRWEFECIARGTDVEVVSPYGGTYVDKAIFDKLGELLNA